MRVLIAEDHPSIAKSVSTGLREEGYAVDVATGGSEALHLARTTDYDCVILDIMLPGMDGWEILESLRKEGRRTPVLCLTARDTTADRVRGLNLGADDYLVKPFAFEELLARVRAIIRRSHGQPSAVVRVGDLELDSARKSVSRAGEPIILTAREYALLEYLVHRRDQVVSRADIWEHIYDNEDESTSNVVDVYIGYLRAKIDKNHEHKLIHTRRGQGYIVTADNPA